MANKYINNYILVSINTITNLILPIITFPYISRIIGPEYLGIINFATSYGYYFMHIANFGIASYAIREVSKVRDDINAVNKISNEIYNINVLFSILSGICYLIGVFCVSKLRVNAFVFFLYSFTIFTNFLSLEWLLQAYDDYKFTTIRSISVRIISIIAVFVFVKKQSDYTIYMLIITISEMGARFSNLFYAKKQYVKLMIRKKFLNFEMHFKSLFTLFVFRMVNGISSNLDKLMIGFLLIYSDVGIYSAGVKFVLLIIPLIENVGIVLFPKINISSSNFEEYRKNLLFNYNVILMIAIPMAVGMFLVSPMVISLFAGKEYLGAISVSRIMSFVIVLCPIGDLLGSKTLLVFNKEKWLLICSSIVAVSNIVFNAILIPLWGINGATIASLVSYVVAITCRYIFTRKLVKFNLFTFNLFKYTLFTVPFIIIYYIYYHYINTKFLCTILFIFVSIIIYMLELYLFKDKDFKFIIKRFIFKS